MKKQTFRSFLHGFGMLVVFVVIALMINYYHYSWTGYLFGKAGLCDYKTAALPVKNGFPQKLSFDVDPQLIAAEMLKNPAYEVESYFRNRGTVVTRKFGDVNYQISFQNSQGSYEGFNLNTSNDAEKHSFPTITGESCTTPDYRIRENVFTMIDDLPVADFQKEEMKEYVRVAKVFRGKFW
jgi:hypothetical protein